MSGELSIPLDIIEVIIDNLATIDDLSHTSLWACARACRYLLHRCRRHIFSSIALDANHSYLTRQRRKHSPHQIIKLLNRAPEIAIYVRKVNFGVCHSRSDSLPKYQELSEILRRFTQVQHLTIESNCRSFVGWNEVANCLQDALFDMLHLPNLTYLSLCSLHEFPISNLTHCSNLRALFVEDVTPASYTLPPTSIQSIALIEYSGGPGSSVFTDNIIKMTDFKNRPLFDFRDLSKYVAQCNCIEDVEIIRQILKTTTQLQHIDLHVKYPCNYGQFSEVLFQSPKSLRKMIIRRCLHDRHSDPLNDLPHQLIVMRDRPNILEELEIYVHINVDVELAPNNQWNELDKVFNPPGWSCLKIASINIFTGIYWKVTLRKLVWTPQLPILLASKNIAYELFVNNIKTNTVPS
ncbi:hypothetical protein BDN70DRAFT_879445 [Pholiota conissans]|uniref:F-box domain-containing protein n=1 Tax=Pholiota conissans TaxID=109636 RepID=A0A9P6CTV4_9AGAR|nr:hypothetical protein BDN70DRAFT_879445 [Pholiota conissans]